MLKSVSQVFLKANGVSALLLLAGLAVNSLAATAFALAGAILAVLAAHLFGAESELITAGLLGFSPVLTAIALGAVFYRPSWRVAIYAMLGTLFTVIAQAALNVALTPLAIPALTAPFVLVTWIFLLPRQCFAQLPQTMPQRRAQVRYFWEARMFGLGFAVLLDELGRHQIANLKLLLLEA